MLQALASESQLEQGWPEPDMSILQPERPRAPKLPLAAFGPAWAEWITTAAEAAACPPDYVTAPLLAAASALIGACPLGAGDTGVDGTASSLAGCRGRAWYRQKPRRRLSDARRIAGDRATHARRFSRPALGVAHRCRPEQSRQAEMAAGIAWLRNTPCCLHASSCAGDITARAAD